MKTNKVMILEGVIYTLLPALAVLGAVEAREYKTFIAAIAAALAGLKAFLSTSYSDSLPDTSATFMVPPGNFYFPKSPPVSEIKTAPTTTNQTQP